MVNYLTEEQKAILNTPLKPLYEFEEFILDKYGNKGFHFITQKDVAKMKKDVASLVFPGPSK